MEIRKKNCFEDGYMEFEYSKGADYAYAQIYDSNTWKVYNGERMPHSTGFVRSLETEIEKRQFIIEVYQHLASVAEGVVKELRET